MFTKEQKLEGLINCVRYVFSLIAQSTGTYNYQYVSKNNYVLEHYRKILGDNYGKYTK